MPVVAASPRRRRIASCRSVLALRSCMSVRTRWRAVREPAVPVGVRHHGYAGSAPACGYRCPYQETKVLRAAVHTFFSLAGKEHVSCQLPSVEDG
jgi:hypothetical protein